MIPELLCRTAAARAAFRPGGGVTVGAGGSIGVPALTYGRLGPARARMLHAAGSDEVFDGARARIGSIVPLANRAAVGADPLSSAARIADVEVSGQTSAVGDLQSAPVELDARIHSVWSGEEGASSGVVLARAVG
jgi:hypothetical protein